jgi:hypothetical protein
MKKISALVSPSFLLVFFLFGVCGALAQGAGDALYFNGYGQWLDMQNFQVVPANGFVIECWVNIAGENSVPGLQSFVGDLTEDYRLGADINRHPFVNFGDTTGHSDTGFTFALNSWYHYALVGSQNGDSTLHAAVYVDGVLIYSANTSSKAYAECNWLRIGNGGNGSWANATIDEVRFWNGSRTEQQIRENMHLTVAGNSTNLLGYWKMDDGNGPTATDQTSNGNDGEFNDSPTWVTSTAPLGAGTSNTQEPSTEGEVYFAGTNLDMNFTFFNFFNTPIVVTHILSLPGGAVVSYPNLNVVYPNYWIVEAYVGDAGASPVARRGSGAPQASAVDLPHGRGILTAPTRANFTFVLGAGEISSSDASTPKNLKLFTRGDTSTGSWTKLDSGATANTDSVTFNGVTQYSSQFAIGSTGNSSLPIQISSIGEQTTGGQVQIEWTTLSETDNYGFYVQRRTEDSKSYSTVSGLIPGAGTSLTQHDYSWTDANVAPGVYYYRLEQINLNGDVAYSNEIKVTDGVESVKQSGHPLSFALEQNYPNPFNPATNIRYSLASRSLVTLRIVNILGQVVAELVNREQSAGEYEVSWTANVPSGVYFYRLEAANSAEAGANFSAVKKLVVVK